MHSYHAETKMKQLEPVVLSAMEKYNQACVNKRKYRGPTGIKYKVAEYFYNRDIVFNVALEKHLNFAYEKIQSTGKFNKYLLGHLSKYLNTRNNTSFYSACTTDAIMAIGLQYYVEPPKPKPEPKRRSKTGNRSKAKNNTKTEPQTNPQPPPPPPPPQQPQHNTKPRAKPGPKPKPKPEPDPQPQPQPQYNTKPEPKPQPPPPPPKNNTKPESKSQHNTTFIPKNYYEILGIDSKADEREIKVAFHKLALKYHPDKNKDSNAEDMFKTIVNAYSVLSDRIERTHYDRSRR